MYEAIKTFVDGENGKAWPPDKGGLRYAPGDPYPRNGFEPAKDHIAYLLGKGNRFGAAVIRETGEQTAEQKPKQAKPAVKKTTQKGKGGGKDDPVTVGAAETPPEPDGQ